MCSPGVAAKYAVRKRIAVPAAFISTVCGRLFRALSITSVSSQSEMLSGRMSPPAKACIIRARLLMLFEAGSAMVVSI